MNELLLSVPVAFGLESLAAREIRRLGYATHQVEDGRVSYYGDEIAVCRSNIWLRLAERVQIKLGDFTALSFSELFERTKAIPWPDLLPPDAAFPVNGHCLNSKLGSVPDCQAIIKKAAVESMKNRWKIEKFSETGALYRINFNIIRDRVTIYVDTSGDGLHKRGYREDSALAPLRETLAAALLELSGWRPGKALWDPFCGSGTIAIEAAMIAANRAPGLTRGFAAEDWPVNVAAPAIDTHILSAVVNRSVTAADSRGNAPVTFRELFDAERAVARAAFEKGLNGTVAGNSPVAIVGSDIERQCVSTARQNAKKAEVTPFVRFFQTDAKDMSKNHIGLPPLNVKFPERGCVVSNPPYGERQGDLAEAVEICREWAPALGSFRDWNWCVISALGDFERIVERKATKRRKINNGKIKCQAYMYFPQINN